MGQLATSALTGVNEVMLIDLKKDVTDFKEEMDRWKDISGQAVEKMNEIWEEMMGVGSDLPNMIAMVSTWGSVRSQTIPHTAEATLLAYEKRIEIQLSSQYAYDTYYRMKTDSSSIFV